MKVFDIYKEKNIDAAVSAGSTGGFLSLATLKLRLVPGVERAALITPFPTVVGKPLVLLDIGASNENTPSQLVQFAKMGRIYSQNVFDVKEPKVYSRRSFASSNRPRSRTRCATPFRSAVTLLLL